jgi:hypothetical protein
MISTFIFILYYLVSVLFCFVLIIIFSPIYSSFPFYVLQHMIYFIYFNNRDRTSISTLRQMLPEDLLQYCETNHLVDDVVGRSDLIDEHKQEDTSPPPRSSTSISTPSEPQQQQQQQAAPAVIASSVASSSVASSSMSRRNHY